MSKEKDPVETADFPPFPEGGGERRFSTEIPKEEIFSDVKRVKIWEILDTDIVVKDVIFLHGDFGVYAVILFVYPTLNIEFTTACGGIVVVKKLRVAKERNLLPLIGQIVKRDRYWDIV